MNPGELSDWVMTRYPALPRPVHCALLRSYTNDVYAVTAPAAGERFVLKIYGEGWRTETEVGYEVALLRHLCAKGLPVAAPVPGDGNRLVQSIETASGRRPRCAVLFAQAPGEKPRPPFTPPLYEAFGRAIARMHSLSDDFTTGPPHSRRPLDLTYLIDEPVTLTAPLFERAGDRAFLEGLAERVKRGIAALTAEGLDWGPIHGDATLDNLHVTAAEEGGVILYDFDSGGPGWRAADLQGWAAHNTEYAERWDAFQQGYSSLRPIAPADLRAAPFLTLAGDIQGIQIDLENRVLRQGQPQTTAYLREQAALLRQRERALFPD